MAIQNVVDSGRKPGELVRQIYVASADTVLTVTNDQGESLIELYKLSTSFTANPNTPITPDTSSANTNVYTLAASFYALVFL